MNPKHRADDEPEPEKVPDAGKPEPEKVPDAGKPRPRIRRRVRTDPVPGSDPQPSPEPRRHASGENDDQLKRDKPPHWG